MDEKEYKNYSERLQDLYEAHGLRKIDLDEKLSQRTYQIGGPVNLGNSSKFGAKVIYKILKEILEFETFPPKIYYNHIEKDTMEKYYLDKENKEGQTINL